MQQQIATELKKSSHKGALKRFFKRTLALFIILFLALVLSGYAPIGAKEINDAFFSLFITDKAGDQLQTEPASNITPQVSLGVGGSNTEALKNATPNGSVQIVNVVASDPYPSVLTIPAISVSTRVNNPTSEEIEVLDNSLLSGAVRYPTSGNLQMDRTMLIFGHSSHLPIVHNKNYQVFNRLNELKAGDTIYVRSDKRESVYTVKRVTLVDAEISSIPVFNDRKLYLVSCNNFAGKEARYVVEAEFARSYLLTN